MRYFLVACFLGVGLGVALGQFLGTLADALESFDLNATPAFLRRTATGCRARRSYLRDLVDTFTTAYSDESRTPSWRLSRDHGSHTRGAAC